MWQDIMLNAFCALCGLAAVGTGAWVVISGQIAEDGLDALFLLIVCLLIAAAFSAIPVHAIRHGFLKRLMERRKPKPAAEVESQTAHAAAGKPQGVS